VKVNNSSNDSKKKIGNEILIYNLSVSYSIRNGKVIAVDNLSFDIRASEGVGIIGESGSGKSTVGYAIMRSLPEHGEIQSGSILFDGKDILKISSKEFDTKFRWKKISMVFQGSMNSLDPVFTIKNQMKEILKTHRKDLPQNKIIATIKGALRDVGLNPDQVMKKYPHELSGGMKQRIGIANALLAQPDLLIADEPTTALDVVTQSQIMQLLNRLKKDANMRILIITHDISLIPTLVDKVIIMYAGQAVEISDVKTAFESPLHPYTQALIKSIPQINSSEKNFHYIKGNPPNLANIISGCRFKDRCPKAFTDCENEPPLIEVNGNHVKCWLYK
jgi:peptide/nickel transport system ATP-binding protein